jgi:PPOX class probable F420-dependent enzyme
LDRVVIFTPEHERLLREPNFAVVATLRPDGSVHQTMMWVDVDGDTVLLNTTSRTKQAHLAADPRIAVLVASRSDPYTYVSIHGLASLDDNGAVEHANKLARKYGQRATFTRVEGERRVIVRVRPLSVR